MATDEIEHDVVVIEPPLPKTVRRPRDLLRLVFAIVMALLIVLFGTLAVTTAAGLEQDLIGASTGLPRFVLSVVNFLAAVGLLVLPVAVSIDLIVRRRAAQMLTALIAAAIGAVFTVGIRVAIDTYQPGTVLEALTKALPDGSRTYALDASLVAVVAFLTVAQLAGRLQWQLFSVVIIGSVAITLVLSNNLTVLAVIESLLLGWALGLAVRYIRGIPAERPDGYEIAEALAEAGAPMIRMSRGNDDARRRRHYDAIGVDGHPYDVVVLDRDQEGAGIAQYLWRQLRVVRSAARPAFISQRRAFEHEALVTYAALNAGVAVAPLKAVTEVGIFAAALAYEHRPGHLLVDLAPNQVTDEVLRHIWTRVDELHAARIAHRGLTADRILLTDEGEVWLTDLRFGEIAASKFTVRLDVAELLVTTGLIVGAQRAVAAAVEVVGPELVAEAVPLVQPLPLTATSRRLLRGRKELLRDIRDVVVEQTPAEPVEPENIRRFQPRTILSVVGLTVAAYFLISQLTQVNLAEVIANAAWGWALVALVLSGVTYVGAALSLLGFTPGKIKLFPTILAQLATTYYGLFAPGMVSGVAVNASYLERSGVYGGVAVASVGVSQLAAAAIHIAMLVFFGALAGAGPEASFTPPEGAIIAVVAVLIVAVIAFSIAPIRHYALDRVRPVFSKTLPRLLDVLQDPKKLSIGLFGNLLLNLGYIFALVASVEAFGGKLSIPAIAIVFLAGNAAGSIVPTPGGVGAVEAALTGLLTAAGLDTSTALSAVLLYRIATFWLPVPLGWLSSNYLSRKRLLFV